jgi:cob(I)alamin adenosyltransferase
MSGRIYTGAGDEGETSLVGGARVPKNSARVKAYGSIDEANSHIGLAAAVVRDELLAEALAFLQHRLSNCASHLATPTDQVSGDTPRVDPVDVTALERLIDEMTSHVPELDGFVLPGGSEAASRLHVARTVMRRAERMILDVAEAAAVDADVLAFVNRASDLLFAAARYANHVSDTPDVLWDPNAAAPDGST